MRACACGLGRTSRIVGRVLGDLTFPGAKPANPWAGGCDQKDRAASGYDLSKTAGVRRGGRDELKFRFLPGGVRGGDRRPAQTVAERLSFGTLRRPRIWFEPSARRRWPPGWKACRFARTVPGSIRNGRTDWHAREERESAPALSGGSASPATVMCGSCRSDDPAAIQRRKRSVLWTERKRKNLSLL